MKLKLVFEEATMNSDALVTLYDSLLTKSQRGIRAEWERRFFEAKLVSWPQRGGIWRSRNDKLLIIGKGDSSLSHRSFNSAALSILLRSSLVMVMAAVDKILHGAISIHFSSLAKKRAIDDLVNIDLSKAYEIAHAATIRKGKGGKIKSRPGHRLKDEVLQQIYSSSYLSLRNLQKICAACGKNKIFSKYSKTLSPRKSPEELQKYWSRIYFRRNCIAHECDIVRKAKARKIHYYKLSPKNIRQDIDFIKSFGLFLSEELQ